MEQYLTNFIASKEIYVAGMILCDVKHTRIA